MDHTWAHLTTMSSLGSERKEPTSSSGPEYYWRKSERLGSPFPSSAPPYQPAPHASTSVSFLHFGGAIVNRSAIRDLRRVEDTIVCTFQDGETLCETPSEAHFQIRFRRLYLELLGSDMPFGTKF